MPVVGVIAVGSERLARIKVVVREEVMAHAVASPAGGQGAGESTLLESFAPAIEEDTKEDDEQAEYARSRSSNDVSTLRCSNMWG